MTTAPATRIDLAAYHAERTSISRSMANVARTKGLATYYGMYVADPPTINPDPPPSPESIAGSVCHEVWLRGKAWHSVVAAYPDDCLKSNGHINPTPAAKFREAREAEGVLYCLKQKDIDRCHNIVSAVRSHVIHLNGERTINLSDWKEHSSAIVEQPLYWTHSSGLELRCCPDFYIPTAHAIWPFDFKVTALWKDFRKFAKQSGFAFQDAFYRSGLSQQIWGDASTTVMPIRFVCVNPEPPHQVAVHHFGPETCSAADRLVEQTVGDIANCYAASAELGEGEDPASVWKDVIQLEDNEHELRDWEIAA